MRERREYQRGDHICVVYDKPDEQLGVAVQYVAEGLQQGERCLYAAESEDALARFRAALARTGADLAAADASGALLLMTTEAAHLAGGRFDSERMLRMLSEAVEDALDAGFTGLRTCGDMSWLLREPPGSSQVVEYEALLNQFFANVRALGMCQYDRSRLPEGLLDAALATHTSVVVDCRHRSNPFYRDWAFAGSDAAQSRDLSWKLNQLRSPEP